MEIYRSFNDIHFKEITIFILVIDEFHHNGRFHIKNEAPSWNASLRGVIGTVIEKVMSLLNITFSQMLLIGIEYIKQSFFVTFTPA